MAKEENSKDTGYFRVVYDYDRVPLDDHLDHGYETRREFREALLHVCDLWEGRVGERIGERNGFYLLRFHDTPGCVPDEEWMPVYMLQPADVPEYMLRDSQKDPEEEELDRAFGFD